MLLDHHPQEAGAHQPGARLTGTLTSRRAVLTVTGHAANQERRFTAHITATR
jgi:hypothetical protein